MRGVNFLIVTALILFSIAGHASAASYVEIGVDIKPLLGAAGNPARIIACSATIGHDWNALPDREHIDFTNGLTFTNQVYITGFNDTKNYGWQQLSSPQLLSSQSWFSSTDDIYTTKQILGKECCMYIPCPLEPHYPYTWDTSNPSNPCGDLCNSAIIDQDFDQPAPQLINPSTLTFADIHGGSTNDTIFYLETFKDVQGDYTQIIVFFRFVRPATYTDALTFNSSSNKHFLPGDLFRTLLVFFGIDIELQTKAVHHTSSDITGASPGFVDAADIAAFGRHRGQCVGYGHTNSSSCQYNWHADLDADGDHVDAGDLAHLSADLGTFCTPSKAAPFTQAVLDWFAIRETGETIISLGRELPEVEIYDEAQFAIAVENPYGYLTNVQSAVEEMDWGSAKKLYR